MNTETNMKAFVGAPRWSKVLLILAAALLAIAVAGLVIVGGQPAPEAAHMTYDAERGDYRYIDVALMTDWLLKITGDNEYTYYLAQDADGAAYIVSLNGKQYASFSEIVAYTAETGPGAAAPAPQRVAGMVRGIPKDDYAALCEVLELSEAEAEEWIGRTYLNAKASPGKSGMGGMLLLFCLAFCLGLIGLAVFGSANGRYKKCMNRLMTLGVAEQAEQELSAQGNLVLGEQGVVMSPHFLYGKQLGTALRYEDVIWLYKRVQNVYFIPVGTMLVAGTVFGKEFIVSSRKLSDETIAGICGAVAQKNPGVMVGFTPENRKAYRARVKQFKETGM